ncbi:MAG TPA: hypothetical protein VLE53_06455 [Gemmatimonadaceae bacterium]|nr:hypothetical protein [Gemmatimonadaceae bacterium]
MSDLPRRFNEEEMAVILKRAAALQAARDDRSSHSLEEIQAIGAQVGIDPALIAHVASAPDLATRRSRSGLFPASATQEERRIETAITTADYGRVLEAIRRVVGTQGRAQQVFDSLEWRTGSDREALWYAVTVTGRPDATHVRVEADFGVAVALMHIAGVAPFLAAIVAAGNLLPAEAAIPAVAAAGVGILAGIRGLWRRLLRKTEATAADLAREIEREVTEIAAQRQETGSAERRLPSST